MPIYFCGDVTIDNYEFYGEFDPPLAKGKRTPTQNGDLQAPKKIIVRQFGGAYLLARFAGVAWSLLFGRNNKARCRMRTLKPWSKFRDRHLNVRLDELYKQPRDFDHNWQISYRLKKCGEEFRVPRTGHEGVTPPQHEAKNVIGAKELQLDTSSPLDLFVVNDRAADARRDKSLGQAIAEANGWTVIKILEPPAKPGSAPLLAELVKHASDRVVAVVPADELRKSGVPISRSLSWERTLRDVIEEVRSGQILPGNTPTHLVVTFDYDAALYLRTARQPGAAKERVVEEGRLVFSIGGAEGEFKSKIDGDMPGGQTAFVSVFAALLYAQLRKSHKAGLKDSGHSAGIETMLAYGLITKRRLLQSGFAMDAKNLPFKMAKTRVAKAEREVPRLYYSEGIFSLLTKPPPADDDPFGSPPDPFIRAERTVKQRAFFDPFTSDPAFEKNLTDQELAIFKIDSGQIPGDD